MNSTVAGEQVATTRAYEHEGRRYLLTDTVGFIRRLPHQLVEGFAATLEETLVADVLLHVADASVAAAQLDAMVGAVDDVLAEIGADELPRRTACSTRSTGSTRSAVGRRSRANRFPRRPAGLGATTRRGPRRVAKERIAERFAGRHEAVRQLVPYEDGRALSELYALGAPIEGREDTPEGVLLLARLALR